MRLNFRIGSQAFGRISKRFSAGLAMAVLMTLSSRALAGSLTLSPALTDDASTGIRAAKTYTHAVSGGAAAVVNGVNFDVLDALHTPANFAWNTNGFTKNAIGFNNGDWVPASGGVSGFGLMNLLGSFTFSSDGNGNPASQTFALSGLTPGETYDARIYIRVWDTQGSGRPINLTYTNGVEVDATGTLWEDRPSFIGYPSDHSAYYVNYQYTAQTSDLVIDALVVEPSPSGSFLMYGLSNEVVPVVPAVPVPSALALCASGLLGLLSIRRQARSV